MMMYCTKTDEEMDVVPFVILLMYYYCLMGHMTYPYSMFF